MTDQIELERKWRDKFPATLSALFAFYQALCTVAILGSEIGSVLIDLFNATIYVGIWASLFFIAAWISQTIAVSCHRTRRFATYTLIIQCIALIFSACVIGFDAYFLIVPTACFFPSTLCTSTSPLRGLFYSENNFNNIKIPLIKGQLACATIMFAFSIDYIIMYVVIHMHIKKTFRSFPSTTASETINANILNTKENVTNPTSFPMSQRITSSVINIDLEYSLLHSANRSRWSVGSMDLSPIEV